MSRIALSSIRPDATIASPLVSVVIPAYNAAAYIARTLDAVFAQTFTNFEVVLVNDGSPDTGELERNLEPYRERIVYILQENLGAGAARNAGLRASRGELIAFLDADDLWLPNYLEQQLQFLRDGGYDLVYCDALLVGDSVLAGKTYMETSPSNGAVTFESLVRSHCNVITSGVLARRDPILEVNLFDETLRNAQDFDLWLRLVRHGARVAYQRKVLLRYTCRSGSLSSGDGINLVLRQLRVFDKIEKSYDLVPAERAQVDIMITRLNAELALEEGRAQFSEERFAEARESFQKASLVLSGWKLRGLLLLLRVAPRWLLTIISRRVRSRR